MGLVSPGLLIVYFMYGLAFFSLGISLLLESRRMPSPENRKRLLPLAVFGLLHGTHEWLEFFTLQTPAASLPSFIAWIRITLLVLSFTSLLAYGVKTLQPAFQVQLSDPLFGAAILIVYTVLLSFLSSHTVGSVGWFADADALARMVIAVPSALLAFMALRKRTHDLLGEGRGKLARYLSVASLGFVAYSLTQIVVPNASVLYAPGLNSKLFSNGLGFPIQLPRTLIAGLIAVAILSANDAAEEERQVELLEAQQARMKALEQAGTEMAKREALQREVTRSIVFAQEDERRRISRELHDETAQALTAMGLTIATIHTQVPQDKALLENLQRVQEINKEMSQGLRRLVHQLRPAQLDDLGLIPALKYLVNDANKNLQLRVTLNIEGAQRRLEEFIETVLFRVAQEGITNIARHANADQAQLTLKFTPDGVQLILQDHGPGFELDDDHLAHGQSGLAGMRERVMAAGGTFSISSIAGSGARIEAFIPQIEERSSPA